MQKIRTVELDGKTIKLQIVSFLVYVPSPRVYSHGQRFPQNAVSMSSKHVPFAENSQVFSLDATQILKKVEGLPLHVGNLQLKSKISTR